MIDNFNVVVVTPAGRKRYLELLIPCILNLRPVVDEYRLWVNTTDAMDIAYMEEVAKQYPDFIKLEYLSIPYSNNFSIHSFFKNTIDPNTVYVRFDDDVVCIDHIDRFKEFLRFRISNPQYFLVYANILNNAVISHIHQRELRLPLINGMMSGYCAIDNIGWNDGLFAEGVHRDVLNKIGVKPDFKPYHMPNWLLYFFERVSINSISWLGADFAGFNGQVGLDEEQWLASEAPQQLQRPNIIFGGFCCVHYAFFTQRPHLDQTDILEQYRALMEP